MKNLVYLLFIALLIAGCATSSQTTTETVVEEEVYEEEVTEVVSNSAIGEITASLVDTNLIDTAAVWYPTTDSYGSSFEATEPLIIDGEINVKFTIAQKVADEWPYVELICQTGGESFAGLSGISITYKCDDFLKIKLSQSDFGAEGDNSYAHYYYEVPATDEWTTVDIDFTEFYQPGWAPASAMAVPLILDNISHIYLVPDVDYSIGESANLSVNSLVLRK